MKMDWLTFGLALSGYALLAVDVLWHARGERSKPRSYFTAAVILAHVICVWIFRYDLNIVSAFSKSPAGFFIFHTALVLIVIAPFFTDITWSRMLAVALVLVTIGATIGAFTYKGLEVLRIPVIGIAVLKGGQALLIAWRERNQ